MYSHTLSFLLHRMYSSEGADGFTSETLDNDYQLTQLVKLPPNVTVEEYNCGAALSRRWIYSNLVDFVQEITLLYDSLPAPNSPHF